MRFEIDVRSALIGAGFLGLVGLVSSQTPSGVTPISRVEKSPIRVAGIPDPRDMIVINEGEPFIQLTVKTTGELYALADTVRQQNIEDGWTDADESSLTRERSRRRWCMNRS